MPRNPAVWLILAVLSVMPGGPALAHAFGQRYDLPMPLWLYLAGAGATVLLSFAVSARFGRRNTGYEAPVRTLPGFPLAHPLVAGTARVVFVALFLLVVAAGFIGTDNPQRNIAPVMAWIVGWIGLAYVSALFGDVWSAVNPWATLYRWCVPREAETRAAPGWLGMWPAVVLFFAFAWLELVSESGESPRQLAFLIVMYSAVTWAGMAVYGCREWQARGEAFSVVFALFGRFAPLGRGAAGGWVLRLPATGLLSDRPVPPSQTAFVLLALSTVTFDGFLETPAWLGLLDIFREGRVYASADAMGLNALKTTKTLAMLAFWFGFIGVYLVCCGLMARAGGTVPTGRVAGSFVLPLVPIAIAYHLAHYLSYLLISGQAAIPLLSDPFGFGWDLFGTAGYRTDIGIVGARFVWNLSVAVIVAGHVMAVWLSHVMALRVFPDARAAQRSQLSMLVLMIGYTMVSLWILSQPVVAG